MKIINILIILSLSAIFLSCSKNPEVIYINGKIYTLDKNNTVAEAIAVYNGKILDIGKSNELQERYRNAKIIDLDGKTVVPGLLMQKQI